MYWLYFRAFIASSHTRSILTWFIRLRFEIFSHIHLRVTIFGWFLRLSALIKNVDSLIAYSLWKEYIVMNVWSGSIWYVIAHIPLPIKDVQSLNPIGFVYFVVRAKQYSFRRQLAFWSWQTKRLTSAVPVTWVLIAKNVSLSCVLLRHMPNIRYAMGTYIPKQLTSETPLDACGQVAAAETDYPDKALLSWIVLMWMLRVMWNG